MPRPQFTSAQARAAGKKGGVASGVVRRTVAHSAEYKAGYSAGYAAYARYVKRWRLEVGRAQARGAA